MKFINKLQKKPRSFRVLIMWMASFFVMAIIVLIWLISFSRGFTSEKIEKEAEATKLPSLFESIEKDFSVFKQKLEANIKSIYGGQEERK